MRRLLLAAGCATLLCSCQAVDTASAWFTARSQQSAALAGRPPSAPPSAVLHSGKPILGVLEAPSEHGDRLPERCGQTMTLRINQEMSANEVVERLAEEIGMAASVDDGSGNSAAPAAPARPSMPGAEPVFTPEGRLPASAAAATLPPGALMRPNLNGNCEQILDQIAGHFNLVWRVRGGTIQMTKYLTRTFSVGASATTTSLKANLSSGGKQASSGATQTASVDNENDVWADIDKSLTEMLPQGSHHSISKASGTVTVITTPLTMSAVADYIAQLNRILSATVAVEVTALYISVSDNDNYGLDIQALYNAGSAGGYGTGFTGLLPTLTSTTAGTGNLAILSPPAGSGRSSSHFAGSQILLNAVSSSSRLADYRTATVVGRNGVAMPVSLTTNQDLVRSVTASTPDVFGHITVTAATDTLNYGFTMQVLPRVIAPGKVSVFLTFSNNDLTSLTDFAVGGTGSSVQLATLDNRSLWNEITLNSGQTLVLAGTEQDRGTIDQQGIGSPTSWLLGGSNSGKAARTRLILLVTPTVVAGAG